jgi:hypothetical protein
MQLLEIHVNFNSNRLSWKDTEANIWLEISLAVIKSQ